MNVVNRIKFSEEQAIDAYLGQSLLQDITPTNSYELIACQQPVIQIHVNNNYLYILTEIDIQQYTLQLQSNKLQATLANTFVNEYQNEQVKIILKDEYLYKLFILSNVLVQVNLENKQVQQLQIVSKQVLDIIQLQGSLILMTQSHLLQINEKQLQNSQETYLQIQGSIQTISANKHNQDQIILITTNRQLLIINLKGTVTKTIQKISKSDVIYMKQIAENDIVITTIANEIIYISLSVQQKCKQEQKITQVKQDYYNASFRTDSPMLGFDVGEQLYCGFSQNYLYIW